MFRAENWAAAFVNSAKTTLAAEEALQYLKIFCIAALSIPGELSGRNDAKRFGLLITGTKCRFSGQNKEDEEQFNKTDAGQSFFLAERFIQLMMIKKCFHNYKKILRCIEKIINKQMGVEEIIIEAAVELDKELLQNIGEKAKKMIGAREIRLIQHQIPELIGGIRIRWGSLLFDGSIKRFLENMAGDLNSQIA